MESVAKKASKSIGWTAIHKIGSMSISFCTNMILARLLSPADFGCIGIILVFVNLGNVFIDAGFGSALIQKKDSNRVDYSTVFYWNLIVAIIIYGALYAFSDSIARYYSIPVLEDILHVLGIILIINAFSIIQTVRLKIMLNFKPLALSFIISTFLAAVVAVVMACNNFGVWSLVWFQIIQATLNSILLWLHCKWHPDLVFSFFSFKRLFGFGSFLLMSSLLTSLCNQIQSLFIGKICSTATLGYYTQAKNLESAPTNIVYSVIGQVAFPIFSKYQDDRQKLLSINIRLNSCIAFVVIPLMTLLIVNARPVIMLVLSDKWLTAVPYFQILCLGGIATCLLDINNYTIAALGKSAVIFKWSLIKNSIGIVMISIGAFFGIYGILIAVTTYYYLGYLIYSILIKKYFTIGIGKQLHYIYPILVYSIILGTVTNFLNKYLLDSYLIYGLTSILFIILYITICRFSKLEAMVWTWGCIKLLLNRQ